MIRATDLKVCLSAQPTQYSVSGKNSSRAAGISFPQSKHLHIAILLQYLVVLFAHITVSVDECVKCCCHVFVIASLKNGNSRFHLRNEFIVTHHVVVVVHGIAGIVIWNHSDTSHFQVA